MIKLKHALLLIWFIICIVGMFGGYNESWGVTNRIYHATCLTGGTPGCLDRINGSVLAIGDIAEVNVSPNTVSHYKLVSDGTCVAASVPDEFPPVTNPGTKCWHLDKYVTKELTVGAGTTDDPVINFNGLNNNGSWIYDESADEHIIGEKIVVPNLDITSIGNQEMVYGSGTSLISNGNFLYDGEKLSLTPEFTSVGIELTTQAEADAYIDIGSSSSNFMSLGYDNSAAVFVITGGTQLSGDSYFAIDELGRIGMGIIAPEHSLHVARAGGANIIMKNLTNENGQDEAESFLRWQDHTGNALADITGAHDGVVDDTKGVVILRTHDGTNLVDRIRVDSLGHVSIGNFSPTYTLDIQGDETVDRIRLRNSTASNGLHFIVDSNDAAHINNKENTELFFATNDTAAMTIDSEQQVGIGTQVPAALLNVEASDGISDNQPVAIFKNIEATGSRNKGVLIKAGSTTADYSLLAQDKDSNGLFIVDGAGNVGIGIMTPGEELNVQGTGETSILVDTTQNGGVAGIKFQNDTNGTPVTWEARIADDDYFKILARSEGGAPQRFVIAPTTGYVGIGTPIPATKLEVVGDITTQGLNFDIGVAVCDPAEGESCWSSEDGCMLIGMAGGEVKACVSKEGLMDIVNKTGSTLENGSAVTVTGSQGNRLTVALADNTDPDMLHVDGMITEDIANNGNGHLAIWGDVHGSTTEPITTTGMAEGDKLYLGSGGPFNWTNIHPTSATAGVVIFGHVQKVHATDGVIHMTTLQSFSIGNDFDGTLRQTIANKSTGTSSASGFTMINDANHRATFSLTGTNHAGFPEIVSIYNEGYGGTAFVVDGNHGFAWHTDPTDSHDFSSFTNEVMRIEANGNVGIGTDNPGTDLVVMDSTASSILDVKAETTSAQVRVWSAGNGISSFKGRNARGTLTNPTAILTGDIVFTFNAQGYNDHVAAEDYINMGRIDFVATEDYNTAVGAGGRIEFETVPNGSLTSVIRLSIDENGNVGIGTDTTPDERLAVDEGAVFNSTQIGGYDFNIKGDNDASLFYADVDTDRIGIGTSSPDVKFQVVGAVEAGDDAGNNIAVSETGDLKFIGTSGMVHGDMWSNTQITVTISDGTPTEVEESGDGFTIGFLNNMTFPTGGDEHYLEIDVIGVYECVWGMSFALASASGGIEAEGGVMVDGAAVESGQAHRTLANSTDTGDMGSVSKIDITSVNQQVSLFIQNETNTTDIDVEHVSISCKQLGGT